MKWYVRRYQNKDGTLTAAGRKRYGYGDPKTGYKVTGSSAGENIRNKISNVMAERKEAKREKYVKNRPWLMSDEELKTKLNRINLEKQYLSALKDVESQNGEKRVRQILRDVGENGVRLIGKSVIEAAVNRYMNKEDIKNETEFRKVMTDNAIKDEARFNRRMAMETARNKVNMDNYIDRAQKKASSRDASSKLLRKAERDYSKLSDKDLKDIQTKYNIFREMENHYNKTEYNKMDVPTYPRANGNQKKKKGNN